MIVLALLVTTCIAVSLWLLSRKIDLKVILIIEGVLKLIAYVFIVQLTLKVSIWLQLYRKNNEAYYNIGLSMWSVRFNII